MKSRVPSKLFLWKKQNFLVAHEQKLSTRGHPILIEHSLVIILRKIKKIKNIKDTSVHFAFMRKNSLNCTSFVCWVVFLFLFLFSLDINYFYANVYQWNVKACLYYYVCFNTVSARVHTPDLRNTFLYRMQTHTE